MTEQKRTKINRLLQSWLPGTLSTASYLRKKGYTAPLLYQYKKSGWLVSDQRGVYRLNGDTVDWFGGLYALQHQLHLPVHAGAKTSLLLQGLGHYIPVNSRLPRCHLFSYRDVKLPAWFSNHSWETEIRYTPTKLFTSPPAGTLVDFRHREFFVTISCAERAALEMCHLVPGQQGFDEAEKIMENLVTLRPGLVQALLEDCSFIKAKRLFLYFSRECQHSWYEQLNVERIELGSGQRQIMPNGRLDKEFLITVPREKTYDSQSL